MNMRLREWLDALNALDAEPGTQPLTATCVALAVLAGIVAVLAVGIA